MAALRQLPIGVVRGSELAAVGAPAALPWALDAWYGRLANICGSGRVSAAVQLLAQAQRQGEPCAWIVSAGLEPFIPDLAAAGVSLSSLIWVRLDDPSKAARAGDLLTRSGGVGLVLIELERSPPKGLLRRLAGHAQRDRAAIILLSDEPYLDSAVGRSISGRVAAQSWDRSAWEFHPLRDRANPRPWVHTEVCDAPPGSP
jgi:hypothetical protein